MTIEDANEVLAQAARQPVPWEWAARHGERLLTVAEVLKAHVAQLEEQVAALTVQNGALRALVLLQGEAVLPEDEGRGVSPATLRTLEGTPNE